MQAARHIAMVVFVAICALIRLAAAPAEAQTASRCMAVAQNYSRRAVRRFPAHPGR